MDPESGDGVVEDLKDWVVGEVGVRWGFEVAREVGPLSTADGAGDAAVADIGGDAIEMESVRALSCEYSLAWSTARAVVERF